MSLTIGKRIILGFSAVVALIAGVGGYTYMKLRSIDDATTVLASDCLPGTYYSGQINSLAAENFGRMLRHVLADSKSEMDAIEQRLTADRAAVDTMLSTYESSITTPDDRKAYDAVIVARNAFRAANSDVIPLSRELKTKEATALINDKVVPAYQKYSDALSGLAELNKSRGNTAAKTSTDAVQSAVTGLYAGVGTALLVACGIGFVIIRSTNRALLQVASVLAQGSEQVASASAQVSSSSQNLAQGASEQAASLEESSSSINEMASMIRKTTETSQQANTLSDEAKRSTDAGSAAMERMATAITDIEASSQETAKIIKTIDEIAFQTNLLALNAAVEAARAGEAGKGFAVVAEEVRNLAMRSAEAAKNTSSLIEESVNKAKNGVTIAQSVATSLKQINDSTSRVTGLIAEIAAATREQSAGIDQISQAVSQMDKVTQTNAANAEETAAASEELSAQAEQMQGCVNQLQTLVGAVGVRTTLAPTTTSAAVQTTHKSSTRPAKKLEKPTTHSDGDFSSFMKAA